MSYALKTFGSSIGRMLTAAVCCAAVLVPASSAAVRPAPIVLRIEATQPMPGELPELTLVRLDPTSLEETARASLGRHYLPYGNAFSPDRKQVVILGSAEGVLLHVDLSRMRLTGEAAFPSARAFWTGPNTIFAVRQRISNDEETSLTAYRTDPFGRHVEEIWSVPERALRMVQSRDQVVLMTTPSHRLHELGGPLRVVSLGPSGVRRLISFDKLRLGLEDWHVSPDGLLPPMATQAVTQTRDDLAARIGVPASEIVASSVVPWSAGEFFSAQPRYEITLAARGEYYRYNVFLGQNLHFNEPSHLAGAPAPSETDLLQARPGSWEVGWAQLNLTPSRKRALVVTSNAILAAIDLATGQVHQTRLAVRPTGWIVPLDERRFVLSVARGIGIARFGSPGVRLIQRGASCLVTRAQNRFLVYGGDCSGLTVYGLDGVRRHRLFRSQHVGDVIVAGRFGYLRTVEDGGTTRIIDLVTGRVLRSTVLPFESQLLIVSR